MSVDLSIVIPIYNEADNVDLLCEKLVTILDQLEPEGEVILVDDGSRDTSVARLQARAAQDVRLKLVALRRNFGQTAALMCGLRHASGSTILFMDGDLQNDPEDIPRLLAKLDEGFDVVSGWRRDRKDNWLTRTLPSRLANRLISLVSGVHLHDFGCSLKAYRREVLHDVRLYGEMHRFIPIYASWQGARVAELPVRHHPRTHGRSNYGLERIVKVLLDLMVVKFLSGYSQKPIYVFGGFGMLSLLLSFLSVAAMLWFKFFGGKSFIETPLPQMATMLFLVGFMSILMGLLAELVMRTWFESQDKVTYVVKSTCNLEPPSAAATASSLSEPPAGL